MHKFEDRDYDAFSFVVTTKKDNVGAQNAASDRSEILTNASGWRLSRRTYG
jgi:hypothetical protein